MLHSATEIIGLQYPDLATPNGYFALHHNYNTEQNFSLMDVFTPMFYVDCFGVWGNNIPEITPLIRLKRLSIKAI